MALPVYRGTSTKLPPKAFKIFVEIYLSAISLLLWLGILLWFKSGGSPDFAHIYAETRLIQQYPASEIYDLEKQARVQREIFGEHFYDGKVMPFVQPPFTLLLLSPLGYLSYRQARAVWFGVNLLLILLLPPILCKWNPDVLRPNRHLILLSALSFYPFLVCLWQGQLSILTLWTIVGFLLLLRTRMDFWAGVMLGLGMMRFHLLYLVILLVVAKRRLRVALGFTLSAAFLFGSSFLWVGNEGYWSYLALLKKMNADHGALLVVPQRFQNWVGQLFLLGLSPNSRPLASALSAAFAVILMAVIWRKKWNLQGATFGISFAATLSLAALGSPYLFIHDLSIIFPVLVFCKEFLLVERTWDWKSYSILVLLLISPLIWFTSLLVAQIIPIQGSVLWLSLLLYFLTGKIVASQNLKVPKTVQS